MPCDQRGNFYVTLDFDHSFTAKKFQVTGNGRNYGYFDYSSLPLTIGPLKADCITSYEFALRDSASTSCFLYKNIGKNCCTDFCKIRILNTVASACKGFDYSLNFNLQSFASSGSYDFYYDGKKLTSISKSELPITSPQLTSSPVNTFHTVSVCTSNDKLCCDTVVYSNPCVCNINHLRADVVDCDMGKKLFNVMINFDHTATSDSFKIGGNSMNYGTFAYKDLPVTIKNLAMHPNLSYEILVLDKADAFCFGSYVLGVVDTCNYTCNISNVKIAPLFCNDSILTVGMELSVTNPGVSGLTLKVDGKNAGAFDYEEKEFVLELPKKTCGESYTIQVSDKIKSNCASSLAYKSESCCKIACKISDVDIVEVCNDNGLDYLNLVFKYQGNADSFLITVNDTFTRTFSYAALPVRLSDAVRFGKELKIKISDKISNGCEVQIIYKVKCEKKLPCSITNFDLKPDVCDSNRYVKANFTFKVANQPSSQFLLRINEGKPDTFVYGQSLYSSQLLFGDCLTKYRFSIIDSKDSMCKATFTLPDTICCEIPCRISDLEVTEGCNDNGLEYLSLSYKYQGNSDSFLITVNDTFTRTFPYAALPVRLLDAVRFGKELKIKIRDKISNGCEVQIIYKVKCEKKLPCSITNFNIKPAVCDSNRYIKANFTFRAENQPSSQFLLRINEGKPDTFVYGQSLYSSQLLFGDCLTKYRFSIIDSKDSMCKATFTMPHTICCEIPCRISDLEVTEVCNDNDLDYLNLSFKYQGNADSFLISINDTLLLLANHKSLPLKLYNLDHFGKDIKISIRDQKNNNCLAEAQYTVRCIKKLTCKLSQLFVKPGSCDNTENFRSDFSFKVENPASSQFVLRINEGAPDTFSYESLSYSTKLLNGDCKTKYRFSIRDTKDTLCSTTFEFTDTICCLSCKLSEPDITYLPCNNGKYGVRINFNFKNSHQYFKLKCSDRSDTILKYTDLPLTINNLERLRPYQISILDSLNTSCTLKFENISKDCPSSLNDLIKAPEISFDGVCLKVEPDDVSTRGELLIYDIAGKVYYRVKFSGRHELNLTPLVNGVYICKVYINQKSFNKKIIKL